LLDEIAKAQRLFPEHTGSVDAAFLSEMIHCGALSRHMARVARTYRSRRAAFLDALDQQLPGCEVVGMDAGLHVVVTLPHGAIADRVVRSARAQGVAVNPLSHYYLAADTAVEALVAGYALLPETQASGAVRVLARAVEATIRGH
jgi:GntR family transcriptional regulator/MocR family aminotransferase